MERRQFLRACTALVAGLSITSEEFGTLVEMGNPPVGTVFMTMNGPIILADYEWLVCDGRQVGKDMYPRLFYMIGNFYCHPDTLPEDGKFHLPDLMARRAT